MQITVKISGMSCQHCVMRVKKTLDGLAGVTSANVSVGQAEVVFDDAILQKKDIEAAITTAGYKILE